MTLLKGYILSWHGYLLLLNFIYFRNKKEKSSRLPRPIQHCHVTEVMVLFLHTFSDTVVFFFVLVEKVTVMDWR